jgi:hypothetical protein
LNDLPALPSHPPADLEPAEWRTRLLSPPLGAALILIGVLAILWLLVGASTGRMGFFPFWPVLIWGFFFFGRPYRGGRRRF